MTPPSQDRGESTALMEPMLLSQDSRHRPELTDLALELATRATGFRASLPAGLQDALASLVRSMNCYYSNLIEGHDTHPIDIERALRKDYSQDAQKRSLQLEAEAHIGVQAWLDAGGMVHPPASTAALLEIHQRFCAQLPAELLVVRNPDTGAEVSVVPGAFREQDVRVGRHVAVSPGAVPRFMQRYEQAYAALGRAEALLAAAAMHHRLAWIHPFLDGNGRVARLMSHALMLQHAGSGGVWSVARGLARDVGRYKELLANCDLPRRNDLDGRGRLSEEALAEFTRFFLKTCIDQVAFMERLMRPAELRARVQVWTAEQLRLGALPAGSDKLLDAVLFRGEVARGEVPAVLDMPERTARRVSAALVEAGALSAESPRAPLRLHLGAALASRWMPNLFPDAPAD
jgi:Fic family protein